MTALALVPEDKTEWLRCKPWIEAALKHNRGTHTIEDVENAIAAGTMHFYSSDDAAVVVEIITTPRKKILNYFLIGGNMPGLKNLEPYVTAWGKSLGCSMAVGGGRKGTDRAFASNGFRYGWVRVYKEI